MSPGILGKKIGMTQVFRPDGQVVPVTLLKAGPCVVAQRKTPDHGRLRRGAARLGRVRQADSASTSRMTGHLKKAGAEGAKFMREFRLRPGDGDFKPGDRVLVEEFKPNDKVDVIGVSKGRGFAGFVKRHHFRGGDASHGSMFHRAPGSIGASSFPSRVFPACDGPATWARDSVTVRNLEIVEVDTEDNVLHGEGRGARTQRRLCHGAEGEEVSHADS